MPSHCYRMRVFDRDLIRGGHYGQRSCEPFRGIFKVSEQCPNMPLSNCPCVSFVAPNVLAVTGLSRPFPSLPWTHCGLVDLKSRSVLARPVMAVMAVMA